MAKQDKAGDWGARLRAALVPAAVPMAAPSAEAPPPAEPDAAAASPAEEGPGTTLSSEAPAGTPPEDASLDATAAAQAAPASDHFSLLATIIPGPLQPAPAPDSPLLAMLGARGPSLAVMPPTPMPAAAEAVPEAPVEALEAQFPMLVPAPLAPEAEPPARPEAETLEDRFPMLAAAGPGAATQARHTPESAPFPPVTPPATTTTVDILAAPAHLAEAPAGPTVAPEAAPVAEPETAPVAEPEAAPDAEPEAAPVAEPKAAPAVAAGSEGEAVAPQVAADPSAAAADRLADPLGQASIAAAYLAVRGLPMPMAEAQAAMGAAMGADWLAVALSLEQARGHWRALFIGAGPADLATAGAGAARRAGLTPVLHVAEAHPGLFGQLQAAVEAEGLADEDTMLLQAVIGADEARLPPRGALAQGLIEAQESWDLLRIGTAKVVGQLLTHAVPLLTERVRWLAVAPINRGEEAAAVRVLGRNGWTLRAERPAAIRLTRPDTSNKAGVQIWRGPLA
ncbi:MULTISPECIES: hypothetical protein [Roseomonadaceae]|uniref:Uncharacterized protein n=1 Tax=Falsiroseomonas oleicola TaxID=2801474 RepID=A0ABS6HC44_9PROT|nr:hypothetical protein [Roseomonas oleicola]MBU8546302.1 hypothetical protein [Roseomonas oleicola]